MLPRPVALLGAVLITALTGTSPSDALARRVVLGAPGTETVLDSAFVVPAGATLLLEGPVHVAERGVLRIPAGTRVEGVIGSYLLVTREGTIEATGTLERPIELTCTIEAKFPGCWGGVIIQGNAGINVGPSTSPAGPRSTLSGCRETPDPVSPSIAYGGCNDADSSGVFRYVRIEYAERGLVLDGVGSATVIEDIQANRSRFEGVLVRGGTARVRELVLTANGTGLRWTDGWRGLAQRIVVQQDPTRFAAGIVGQNTGSGDVDALPRSQPVLYNATVIATSTPTNPTHGTAQALVLERGTAGVLRNVFLYAPHIALELADAATCAQRAIGALTLRNVLTAGATSLGSGPVDAACPTDEAALLADAAQDNTVLPSVAGLMQSTNDLLLPDLRPVSASALANAAAETPPANGFFSATAFVGAVPATFLAAQIPWFSGWTVAAPQPSPTPNGVVRVTVRSPFRGLLPAVAVRDDASGLSAITGVDGRATLALPAGSALIGTTSLPFECTAPAPQLAAVTPDDTVDVTLTVPCWPRPGRVGVDGGDGFTCAVADQGTFCFGLNSAGQLGNATTTNSTVPVQVFATVSSVTAGGAHACGRDNSGVVRCWGAGGDGQLGDGAGADQSNPVLVAGGHVFLAVSAGRAHTCGVKNDGSVWCWGSNSEGQLGTANTVGSLVPVQVQSGVLFAAVRAGGDHTCALDRSGAAYCWGANDRGQLGDATTTARSTPVAVSTMQRFGWLATGDRHSCALDANGVAQCWGANTAGAIGDGTTVDRLNPAVVSSPTLLADVVAGAEHSCAVSANGLAKCWGENASGQLGTGDFTDRVAPTLVAVEGTFRLVLAGTDHTCGLAIGVVTGDGGNEVTVSRRTLLCWGSNSRGQFGRGDLISALTPVPSATGLTFP
ncbi:MAG: hypothetical protein IT357_02625 [Gemmatimonadaceae bacterium]|nr:hypothetical protein [Gemmatimonadaceae bacterium]